LRPTPSAERPNKSEPRSIPTLTAPTAGINDMIYKLLFRFSEREEEDKEEEDEEDWQANIERQTGMLTYG